MVRWIGGGGGRRGEHVRNTRCPPLLLHDFISFERRPMICEAPQYAGGTFVLGKRYGVDTLMRGVYGVGLSRMGVLG